MNKTASRRFVAVRILLNVMLVFLMFAIVIPNCIVPRNVSAPEHFAWIGLIWPFFMSGMSLSPFLNHWPPKISYDFLALTDGLVDRRFSAP
jgi:hypothetical protein